jgi:hypothetical protein
LQPVIDEKPGLLRRAANFGKYTWTDVEAFRDQRHQVAELKEWAAQNGKGVQIDCVLQGPNAIRMDQCVQGLQNVVVMLRQFHPGSYPAGTILVGDITSERIPFLNWLVRSSTVDSHHGTMLVDFDDSAKAIYDRMQL